MIAFEQVSKCYTSGQEAFFKVRSDVPAVFFVRGTRFMHQNRKMFVQMLRKSTNSCLGR